MADPSEHVEPGYFREGDVEEQEVRLERVDEPHGLGAVRRFADDGEPVDGGGVLAQAGPRVRLILHDHGPYAFSAHRCAHRSSSDMRRAGRVRSAHVSVSLLWSVSVASLP